MREVLFRAKRDNGGEWVHGYYGLGSSFNKTDLTVIGNIHDNPELITKG